MKNLFEYDVYDRNRDRVGFVENLWADSRDEIGFIGVKTGWLGFGRNHVIPAGGFTVDDEAHSILVPYDGDLIKSAPSLDADEELEPEVEREVYSHFGVAGERRSHSSDEFQSTGTAPTRATGTLTETPPLEGRASHEESVDMPLMEEHVHISKREKDLGEVRLRKVVRTETVNQPVELRHEDVVIERVAGGSATPGEHAFTEEVASIPLSSEEAVVEKTVESAGTVRARKVSETEKENISATVRKEDVEVERSSDTTGRASKGEKLTDKISDALSGDSERKKDSSTPPVLPDEDRY